ncbi:transporter [Aureispira anguillae]|nr:transporter [Aureispira anguillae]
MRTILIILCVVLLKATAIQACDICGCGVGGYYSGMLPQYHKNFIGLRWRFSYFKSDLGHEGENIAAYSKEYFHSLELMGRFYPHRRVQLLAFVPLNYHLRNAPTETNALVGLGDLSVLALYNIYNTSFIAEKNTKHNLLVGGGIKVPTGSFQRKDAAGALLTPSLQLGTGSVDFLITGVYTLRHKRWGLNTNVAYKINLPNKNTYQFGNQLTASATAFFLHKIKNKEWGLMPKLGIAFEQAKYNLKYGYKRINTGGNQLIATAGLEMYYKKIQLGLSYQQPTWQNLSNGLVEAGPRFMANINYLF